MTKKTTTTTLTSRPPVVVVMGHIDHGKSTLLDYIRKSNVAGGEAGGITQHLSAYVVSHKDQTGADRTITFLDTPGHEAFSGMRNRGAQAADIAILVVSAEDSVKAQTLEAWKTITEWNLPFIVAINKIDKPNANPEKVKLDLAEKGIYLEGYGGDISFAEISAKVGTGVDHLLELISILADISEFTGDPSAPAEGIVIESHLDARRGMTATLIVRNGTLTSGMHLASASALASTRMMQDFLLRPIKTVSLSDPVGIVGWSEMPEVGGVWQSFETKKEAEKYASEHALAFSAPAPFVFDHTQTAQKRIPIIIRTDTAGTADAVLTEIRKLELPNTTWKVLSCGVGVIGEADVRTAGIDPETIIIGFNTKVDPRAKEILDQSATPVSVEIFTIIYKLSDHLKEIVEARRPRIETTVVGGTLKVQRIFNRTKDRQVAGGLVASGEIAVGNTVRILRREAEIGKGTIVGLEQNKSKTKLVAEGLHCGALIEARIEIVPGDVIEAITKIIE